MFSCVYHNYSLTFHNKINSVVHIPDEIVGAVTVDVEDLLLSKSLRILPSSPVELDD